MEWIPTPWQENLLRHFLSTGDYWVSLGNKHSDVWASFGAAMLLVGGNFEDLKKLNAIADILGGKVRRNYDQGPWEYLWFANEHTERYLRWFLDKWDNRGVFDTHDKRRYVVKALEAFDEDHRNRQDKPDSA